MLTSRHDVITTCRQKKYQLSIIDAEGNTSLLNTMKVVRTKPHTAPQVNLMK
ncbi:MAG: hypothetical protein IJQ97_02545 [Paludibacteraceae bacterium]|nr:hypothetical protein [Paludibacteraceae bacterium]